MWDYLGEHNRLLLGIAASAIWLGAILWYLLASGFARTWWAHWRNRHTWPNW